MMPEEGTCTRLVKMFVADPRPIIEALNERDLRLYDPLKDGAAPVLERGLTHRDHSVELDRRARRGAGIDLEKPVSAMSRAEAAAYLQATRAELHADDWLRVKLAAVES